MNNNLYMGIDLGTSSVKVLVVASDGKIVSEASQPYDIYNPHPEWSEQNPNDWWRQTLNSCKEALKNVDKASLKGISFSGQMHGLVVLDKHDEVIRPCILWNDERTTKETKYLNEIIGKKLLTSATSNIAFNGFTAPKILWMRNNEPENFQKIAKIMLPKDYLIYQLTGKFVTDVTDASGTLLFDVDKKEWSKTMVDICGISASMLPKAIESYQEVGFIKKEIAAILGVSYDVRVIAGAADNAAAAIGNGIINDMDCNISLGTSGTIFVATTKHITDKENALHSFCHSNGKYYLMGCILSAARCRKWWLEDVIETTDYKKDEEDVKTSNINNDLIFLPYLSGERCPYNDPNVKGAFIGLTATTSKKAMSRAVMEGVAFAIRDCYEVMKENMIIPTSSNLCGGGAKSETWCQIMSDVLNIPIKVLATEQGPSLGACILAMVGCHEYESLRDAANKFVQVKAVYYPKKESVLLYNKLYQKYHSLYQILKDYYK